MIEIYVLSPGWFFDGSHARGQEARLYLSWLWHRPGVLRPVDCYVSILLRPLEWLFPIARINRRWVVLGRGVKPEQLRRRLGLPAIAQVPCLAVRAGDSIFLAAATTEASPKPRNQSGPERLPDFVGHPTEFS